MIWAIAPFEEDERKSHCENGDDVLVMARMILEWIGRHNAGDDALTIGTASAIAKGVEVMARSDMDLAKQLESYWNSSPTVSVLQLLMEFVLEDLSR